MLHVRCLIAAVVCAIACQAAEAGRSSVGDESDVPDAGDCEIELGFERVRTRGEASQRERLLRLACGVGWHTEVEVAHARQHSGAERGESLQLEAKTMLRERRDGRIGWSLALGLGAERSGGAWRRSAHAVAVEATRSIGDAWLVEAQLGVARDVIARRHRTLWAAAVEHAIDERLELRAEVEDDNLDRPRIGVGLKYTPWPDGAQLRLSYATRSGPRRETSTALSLQFEF